MVQCNAAYLGGVQCSVKSSTAAVSEDNARLSLDRKGGGERRRRGEEEEQEEEGGSRERGEEV